MSKTTGALNLSANYEVKIRKPLDSRSIVTAYTDLTDTCIWGTGEECNAYNGMEVIVVDIADEARSGIYRLFDQNLENELEAPNYANEANWHKIAEISDINRIEAKIDEHTAEYATKVTKLEGDINAAITAVTSLQATVESNTSAITLLADGADTEKIDGVKDLLQYVEDHEEVYQALNETISSNTTAIADEATRAREAEQAAEANAKAYADDLFSQVNQIVEQELAKFTNVAEEGA